MMKPLFRALISCIALSAFLAPAAMAVTSSVKPVYYVPTDKSWSFSDFHGVQCGVRNVQRWYSRELFNDNARFDKVITYYGNYSSNHCLNVNMGDCIADVVNGTGIDPWTNDKYRAKLLIIGRGFQGWAGGTGDTAGHGYAVVGAESLVAQSECAGNWWCNQEVWNGTVIHELGHTFSLPHSADPNSIMGAHSDFENKHFTAGEPSTVATDPATPTKDPNWTRCEFDEQCASNRCGCNGGNTMYCLPHSGYPKYCSSGSIPNWEHCRNDSDCQSGYCAPDHRGEYACLPHTGYQYCPNTDIFIP